MTGSAVASPSASAPGAPPRTARRVRRVPLPSAMFWLGAAYVVLATLAQLARQPGVPSWDSIWQEDGGIFYSQALSHSFVWTLFHPYNSYLHIGPRLIAEVATWFPVRRAAALLSGGEAFAVSMLSLYVYYASASMLRTHWARAAVALSLILLPAAGYETNAVLSDMHWYLTFAAFWAIVSNPHTRREVALAAGVVALAVLSDPLTGVLLPACLLVAWRQRRSTVVWVVPFVFVATLVIQARYGFLAHPAERFAPSHWNDLPGIYGLRVTGSLFVGDRFLHNLFLRSWGWYFVYGSFAAAIAIAAYALRRPGRDWRAFVGLSFALSLIYLVVPCMERGTANFLTKTAAGFSLNGSRYTVLPVLFLVPVVAGALERRTPRISAQHWRTVQILAAAWTAFIVLSSYSITTTRSPGPSWKGSMALAREKCAGKMPRDVPQVQSPSYPKLTETIYVWVAPNVRPPLWNVQATCRQILK